MQSALYQPFEAAPPLPSPRMLPPFDGPFSLTALLEVIPGDAYQRTLCHTFAQTTHYSDNQADALNQLLSHALLNPFEKCDKDGRTPLHYAAITGNIGFIAAADPEHIKMKDRFGKTPYDYARQHPAYADGAEWKNIWEQKAHMEPLISEDCWLRRCLRRICG